jgi:hypothetical protein
MRVNGVPDEDGSRYMHTQQAPQDPGSFEDFFNKKMEEIFDTIMTRGIGRVKEEVKGAMLDTLVWQEDTDAYEAYKKLKAIKRKVKVRKITKTTVKKTVKKVAKKKSKAKRK